jgi:tetratricopeptide (TPR) repeat protein
MVQDSPLFGIGQGSMLTLYPKYRSLDVIQLEGGQYCRVDHVHCDILEALLNWGFLGFFFYLLILGIILYWGFYSAIYESNFVKLGFASSLLTYIVQNLFSFSIVATSFLFWLLLGATVGVSGKTKLVERKISSTQRFIFIFLTLSLLLLLSPIVKRYIADRKFKLGKLAEEAHYIDYAILYYKEAIDLNPYEKNYYESLVDVYLRVVQEGKVPPEKRDSYINESINLAKKAIKLAHCDSILYNLLGSAYFLRGDKKRALYYFKKAQLWEPYFIDAHNNEGMVYISLQDYKKAKEAFKRILKFDSKVAQAWYFWGYSAYKAGFKEEAKYALSKFIKLFPNDLRISKAKNILKEL